jgi:hypothetical protein
MLQELTNKIKKIIPEIEELKFGCKVEFENFKQILIGTVCYGDDILSIIRLDGENIYERNKEHLKIIGRPITLEDVLRCLEIKPSNVVLSVWCDGTMRISNGEIFLDWQLGKPLHEQSKETIKKLNKLI